MGFFPGGAPFRTARSFGPLRCRLGERHGRSAGRPWPWSRGSWPRSPLPWGMRNSSRDRGNIWTYHFNSSFSYKSGALEMWSYDIMIYHKYLGSQKGDPQNGCPGWLIFGKIPSFEMDDDWGYLYFRKPPSRKILKSWKTLNVHTAWPPIWENVGSLHCLISNTPFPICPLNDILKRVKTSTEIGSIWDGSPHWVLCIRWRFCESAIVQPNWLGNSNTILNLTPI